MVNVAIFASGSGTNFENIVKSNLQYAVVKVLVVDVETSYAIERAKKLGIPYIYVNPKEFISKKEYEEKINTYLKEYAIEVIALAGYMRIVGETLLSLFPNRIINIHPAYLPSFPGAHGIKDAYEAKVDYSGVTIHYIDEHIDTGEIIAQEKVFIDPSWTLEQFEEAIHLLEYKMYPQVLDSVCREIENEKSVN